VLLFWIYFEDRDSNERKPEIESWRGIIKSGLSSEEEVLNENELKAKFEFSNLTLESPF